MVAGALSDTPSFDWLGSPHAKSVRHKTAVSHAGNFRFMLSASPWFILSAHKTAATAENFNYKINLPMNPLLGIIALKLNYPMRLDIS
jgi:hypothetical protein